MTKAEVLTRLNMTQADMARMFNVSASAVAQWPDDEPLPRARDLQLKYELHPEIFATENAATEEAA